MIVPEQTYRWLASIDLLSDEADLLDRKMVAIPPQTAPHFESGFIIGEIVKSIFNRADQQVPAHLHNIKMDTSKSTRIANWNFVWLSFDSLNIQFDPRIKDLILQGENALIVEVVKQLCERDENKDYETMKMVTLHEKLPPKKVQKNQAKPSSLDIKKLNLQKNPDESQSSLQFLILLLTSSLGLTVEEVLGLFTNQNKYLAHIIVKGVNDDYSGILLFYTLLNKHVKKVKQFTQNDPTDAFSCLYAIKPGFISKESKISQLTLKLFSQLNSIYDWFISEASKGSTTLLLGIKRHPHLVSEYLSTLLNIIKDQEVHFFTSHFKQCFRDNEEMIEVCNSLIAPLGQSYISGKLIDVGIIGEWLEIASQLFDGDLEAKVIVYQFIGNAMLWLPQSIEESEDILSIFRTGWEDRKIYDFIVLINEMFEILENLAYNKSPLASKVYQIIIELFVNINEQTQKKQYLIQNFSLIIPNYPKMPTYYFIQSYVDKYLRPSDYTFMKIAIDQCEDVEGLTKIGQTLFGMFVHDTVANQYLGPMIYTVAKKTLEDEIGQNFIKRMIKEGLNQFSTLESQKKIPQVAKPQPMYFNWKGNSEKLSESEIDLYKIKECQSQNLMDFIEKLALLSKKLQNDSLQTLIREALLDSNAYLRKNTNKIGHKKLSNLLRKFGISKQDQLDYDEQYRNRKSIQQMQQSIAHRKQVAKDLQLLAASRVGGPENLKKQFSEMIQKRRKQEEERRRQEERKMREDAMKQTNILKELQLVKLMKGFGSGEAELKEFGFWQRLMKQQNKQLELYPPNLMEARDTEYIENIFKKYHRAIRFLFTKYTSSMYSTKSTNRFEDNQIRKQTISMVEIIKFLKDYKLFFLTSNSQIQLLLRDLNVRLLNRKQTTQELDFTGFEHFLVQFSAVIYTKPHTISAVKKQSNEQIKKNLIHLSHAQLLEELFHYIKMVFAERGEKTAIFDEPESAYFNESEVVKEFAKRLEEDPNYILPEGYKKVTEKTIKFVPKYSQSVTGISESYMDVLQVLDEIFYESSLKFHLIEPTSHKTSKIRVKPSTLINVKPKLMSESVNMDGKERVLSALTDKKSPSVIPPLKMMERKVLSFGMKLGLSHVSYKDKLLGQQVAYVIDDMLTAVQNGKKTLQKDKITNQVLKKRKQMEDYDRKMERQKEKKRKERKQELEKMKKQITEKKEKQKEETKQEREKKRQKKLSRNKKRKEEEERYRSEQKAKLQEKKKNDDEEKKKELQQKKKRKSEEKKAREKFKEFNKEQIEKYQKSYDKDIEKRKKVQEQAQIERKRQEEMKVKLRQKIRSADKKIISIRQKNNQELKNLYSSPEIVAVFKEFQPHVKGLYAFLIKSTFRSITDRKHNNQIIWEQWHYFSYTFQLCPLIISAKQIQQIFISLTKDKQIRKEYFLGLNYEQFQQALLRVAIKHKTIWNKISEKIREDSMSQKEINSVIDKDIQEKEKNEFDEPKDYNVRHLLVEEDINQEIIDDYGDINKVTPQTLKGLFYYLKVPKQKKGQQERFRQIIAQKLQNKYHNYEKLRQKLKEQYTLKSPPKKSKSPSVAKKEEKKQS